MVKQVNFAPLAPRFFGCLLGVFFCLVGNGFAQSSTPVRFDVSTYQLEGNSLLPPAEVEKLLAPYTGPARTFADVEKAREALSLAYFSRGFGTVNVSLPEQEVKSGVIRLKVLEGRIGKVSVTGTQFFDNENIRASLPFLREGEVPNTRKNAESLNLANDNPAKQTSLVLKSGANPGEVDATLRVTDEKPWKVFGLLDNTGTSETGKLRLGIGFQHANVANRDHVLTAQYVTSPEKLSEVQIFGASYRIPIYSLGDSVDLSAGYSSVNSGVVADVFNVSGKGTVFGVRYNHHLPKVESYTQKLIYGLEYKAYKNAVDFSGAPIGNDITVHPASVTYSGAWHQAPIAAGFYAGLVKNIPGGNNGDDEDFNLARLGADANYSLARFGLNASYALANWQARAVFDGQYTRDALVAAEQFGIGGVDSVRGFNEREITNDEGYRGSVELYTPDFGPAVGVPQASARALIFYDFGSVSRNQSLPDELTKANIASTGLGLRLGWGKHINLRLDYAYVLKGAGFRERGDSKIHFGLNVVY